MKMLTSCLKAGARVAAVGILAANLISGAAMAQESFSESHLEAAKKVVIATNSLSAFDDLLPVLAEQTRTIFVQADPFRSDEIVTVTNEVALELVPRRKDLNRSIYEIWARRFSEEELNKLAEFYGTPLGQKLAEAGPSITALALGAARQWQDNIGTEMVSTVRERLEKVDPKPAE
jgi:hypothetical protein